MQTFDNPKAINLFILAATRGALRLEIAGMKRRGQSALAQLRGMGYKGSRETILAAVTADINKAKN
jgi:hypothetical protein